jgi:hypothetical protein
MAGWAALSFSLAQAGDLSPEYFQLLNDLNGTLKNFGPGMTRGPACAPEMVDAAKQAMQGGLFGALGKQIVVKSLETGGKLAAGALGVPGGVITTYSLVRCAMEAGSPEEFARCAVGEAVRAAGGSPSQAADAAGEATRNAHGKPDEVDAVRAAQMAD